MGVVKFTLAAAVAYGIPLFGVIVLRAGWRHAYIAAGAGWWSALWLSLFWMVLFFIAARLVARFVPPFSWLMREWRQANVEGFKMMFGFGGRPRPEAGDPSGMRVVGRSKA